MSELDQVWLQMLDDAAEKADDLGRKRIADFLRLKATNDTIRATGVGWLFDTLIEIAGPAMGGHYPVTIERDEPHTFVRGNSNMVGSCLAIRQGVRCLTVEAGWARVPSDGIMQKGALAFARISHFGIPKAGGEIRLVHMEALPQWLDEKDSMFDSGKLEGHFRLFLGS